MHFYHLASHSRSFLKHVGVILLASHILFFGNWVWFCFSVAVLLIAQKDSFPSMLSEMLYSAHSFSHINYIWVSNSAIILYWTTAFFVSLCAEHCKFANCFVLLHFCTNVMLFASYFRLSYRFNICLYACDHNTTNIILPKCSYSRT